MMRKEDPLDRLVIFLAKRDGIDKLVKTFQYVAKLAHWRLLSHGQPSLADRAKKWEVSCGTSRKAFRTGRFLTGLNALRNLNPKSNPRPNAVVQVLAVLANGGEMVYFFFDHLLWLARIGFLDTHLATRMSFISAFGESFGYVFFIISDLIAIVKGLGAERRLVSVRVRSTASGAKGSSATTTNVSNPSSSSSSSSSDAAAAAAAAADDRVSRDSASPTEEDTDAVAAGDPASVVIKEGPRSHHPGGNKDRKPCYDHDGDDGALRAEREKIRSHRVMATLAIAANVADLIIALADIEPNPFCCHALTLGISGLVSAWSGWYRNWPQSK